MHLQLGTLPVQKIPTSLRKFRDRQPNLSMGTSPRGILDVSPGWLKIFVGRHSKVGGRKTDWRHCSRSSMAYRKFPNYSDTLNICCNHSKIWTMWLYHRVMSPNDADGMANSVDPDQTAPLIWVCTVCPGLSVRKLRIITAVDIPATQRQTHQRSTETVPCSQLPSSTQQKLLHSQDHPRLEPPASTSYRLPDYRGVPSRTGPAADSLN